MAYNIAANLNPIDPVGNFLAARQARQQSDQQNMLFEQRQQDRVAQQQAGAAQAEEAKQKAAIEWGVNAVGVLSPLKDRPDEFNRVADVFAAEAAQRGIPLRRDEITPESVAAIEAQLRVRGGIAMPKPTAADVPDYGLGNVNPGDYTPESVQAYVQSVDPRTGRGNFSLLKKQYAPQSAQIVQAAGGVMVVPRVNGDAGPARFVVDPATNTAGNAAAAAAEAKAKEVGQAQGMAQANLPTAEAQAEQGRFLISQMLSHPGLKRSVGAAGAIPNFPGSDASNFAALLEQLKGQQFLAAFQALKGGGAITQPEGEKAQAAIASLSTAQDEKQFRQQLMYLRSLFEKGLANARRKAGQQPQSGAPAAPAAPAGGNVVKLGGGATLERID